MPIEMPLIPSKQLIIFSAYSMILKRRGIVTTINAAPYTFRLENIILIHACNLDTLKSQFDKVQQVFTGINYFFILFIMLFVGSH